MTRLCLVALLLMLPARGEIIDRIAITVSNRVITELEIDEELRVTALLNHQAVDRSLELRRDAADRLVEQLLIKIEMELSRYELPSDNEITKYYEQIEEENGGPGQMEKTLHSYYLTPAELRSHLALQLTELKFIEVRFRPDVGVSDSEVEAAYRDRVAAWKTDHNGPEPTMDSIRETLVEQRTDAALDSWLTESRKRVRIVYLDKALE